MRTLFNKAGKQVRLNIITTNQYGRSVAEVWASNQLAQSVQAATGNAYSYQQYSKDCPSWNVVTAAQQQASANHLGVWGNPNSVRPWDWRRRERLNQNSLFIIGGIYYLIKRRRIPFRQAVFNRWVIASSLIFFLLDFVGRAGSYLQQETSHVYPETTIRRYTAGCVDGAKAKLDSSVAQKLCSCSVVELQKAYTYGEFKKLTAEMEKSKTIPSGFKGILTSCAQKPSL